MCYVNVLKKYIYRDNRKPVSIVNFVAQETHLHNDIKCKYDNCEYTDVGPVKLKNSGILKHVEKLAHLEHP